MNVVCFFILIYHLIKNPPRVTSPRFQVTALPEEEELTTTELTVLLYEVENSVKHDQPTNL